MSAAPRSLLTRSAATVVATAAVVALVGAPGTVGAAVNPGAYTSTTTLSSGAVILRRVGHVDHGSLVLIGRYPIHRTSTGGYVDFFPGHRVFMNRDGHGGYRGPAYLGGVPVGSFTLTPRR